MSDRDYAKELSDAAKDTEYLQQKANGANDDNKSERSINSIGEKSVGSSTASDRSKIALMLRKKRELMEERLDTPIKAFVRNANTFTLFFFLLMAASASLSYTQIFMTDDALKNGGFSSLLSRTTLQRFGFHIRRLNFYTAINDTYYVKKIREDLYDDLKLWRTDVMKLYTSGPGTVMKTNVRIWDGEQYRVEKKSALDLSILIENAAQYVNQTANLFDNRAVGLKNPNVRFIFDNANYVTDFFTDVRKVEINNYIGGINFLRTALLACKISIAVLSFIFSLVMPYFSYHSFIAR